MLVCIPYHESIPADYPALVKAIQRNGTNPNHTLAVLSLRSQDEPAFHFITALGDYFGRLIRHSIDDQPETSVMTANRFYNAAVRVFQKYKPSPSEAENAPMLYMDPTFHPQIPRWLDSLQSDYFRSGAPKVFGYFPDNAPRGPIILSREYVNTSSLAQFLPNNVHWRNYLSWELLKDSVKATGIGTHESAVLSPPKPDFPI